MDLLSRACTTFILTISLNKTKVMFTPPLSQPHVEANIFAKGTKLYGGRLFCITSAVVSLEMNPLNKSNNLKSQQDLRKARKLYVVWPSYHHRKQGRYLWSVYFIYPFILFGNLDNKSFSHPNLGNGPVGWCCRIHQQHLCSGVRSSQTSVLDMALDMKLVVWFQWSWSLGECRVSLHCHRSEVHFGSE